VGTVVTGKVERGKVKSGEEVEIVGLGEKRKVKIKSQGIQAFRKFKEAAVAGDDAGIALSGVNFEEVMRGQVLAAPNTATSHIKVMVVAEIFKPSEGGRKTAFGNGFRPQFFFHTADVTGIIKLPADKIIDPKTAGDVVEFEVELGESVAIEEGTKFII